MNRSEQITMSLSQLLDGVIKHPISKDISITGISEFSGDVEKGDLFIALGANDYSCEAISLGAATVASCCCI